MHGSFSVVTKSSSAASQPRVARLGSPCCFQASTDSLRSSFSARILLTIDERRVIKRPFLGLELPHVPSRTERYGDPMRSLPPPSKSGNRPGRSTTSRRSELLNVDLAISRFGPDWYGRITTHAGPAYPLRVKCAA